MCDGKGVGLLETKNKTKNLGRFISLKEEEAEEEKNNFFLVDIFLIFSLYCDPEKVFAAFIICAAVERGSFFLFFLNLNVLSNSLSLSLSFFP